MSNYLLQVYGRPDAKVSVDQVQRLRSGAQDNTLLTMTRVAMAVGAVLLVALLIGLFSRRRNRPH
ncbi:hypothetical protein D3C71_2204960 [compost metagenome]